MSFSKLLRDSLHLDPTLPSPVLITLTSAVHCDQFTIRFADKIVQIHSGMNSDVVDLVRMEAYGCPLL